MLPLDAATLVATAAWVAADGGEEAALAALYLLAGEPGLPPPRAAALAAEVPASPASVLAVPLYLLQVPVLTMAVPTGATLTRSPPRVRR